MNKEIIAMLRQNTKEITDLVSSIDSSQTHVTPPSGKWSVIQNCDHLMSVDFGTYSLMASEGKVAEEGRESLTPMLENIILDRSRKATAPPQLVPKGKTDTIEKFVTKYPSLREKMITSIETKDLTKVCDVFPHFVFGYLTYGEWMRFSMLHAKRHMLQVEEILEELKTT